MNVCPTCKGSGMKGITLCPTCDGNGYKNTDGQSPVAPNQSVTADTVKTAKQAKAAQ